VMRMVGAEGCDQHVDIGDYHDWCYSSSSASNSPRLEEASTPGTRPVPEVKTGTLGGLRESLLALR
jgi:hypothetical protein